MWIRRNYVSLLKLLGSQYLVVVLTGPRQIGKTALLQKGFPKLNFVTLDLPSVGQQAETSPDTFLAQHQEPLIVDEVQYAPGLFRYLKAAVDAERDRNGRFFLTGSQKFTLMKGISESLAGRAVIVEMDTLSSAEILGTPATASTDRDTFIWRGGFPALYKDPTLGVQDFYSSYVATYLERDLRQQLRVGSLRDFERFLRSCAIRSAQLVNLSDMARDVGIAVSTAREWLTALEASGLIYLLEPYFANLGKRLIKAPKMYMRDTGLLCFLLGFDSPKALVRSQMIGAVWETFVLNQLIRHQQYTRTAAKLFYFRDTHGTEVDFLIDQNGRVRLMEAKWAENPDAADAKQIVKVRGWLGALAADEHWIACRTSHEHLLANPPGVRAIDAWRKRDWFLNSD
jgi:uncharacterized protein